MFAVGVFLDYEGHYWRTFSEYDDAIDYYEDCLKNTRDPWRFCLVRVISGKVNV